MSGPGSPRHPASIGQRGLWFEQHAEPASNAYNLGACLRFRGAIDPARLAAAIDAIARRHPLMRARFALDGSALAWSADDAPPPLTLLEGAEAQSIAGIEALLLRPYSLEHEAPWRFALAPGEAGTTLLGLGCHHIVSDLHSMVLVVRELDAAYAGNDLGPAPFPYDAFTQWQDQHVGSAAGSEASHWWQAHWNSTRPTPLLALAKSAGEDGRLDFAIEGSAAAAIAGLVRETNATPFAVMLTALQAALARRSGRRAAVVAAPASGRNDPRFAGTVGYFVNLLPLTLETREGESARALVQRNARDVREGLRHGQYPFGAMMRDLQHTGAPEAARAVQATLTFQKARGGLEESLARLALGLPGGGFTLGSLEGVLVRFAESRPQFPLGIAVAPTAAGFAGVLTWQGTHLDRVAAQAILGDWMQVMEAAAAEPDRPLDVGRGSVTTLASALAQACERHGDAVAVSGEEGTLTYRELDTRACGLAARLASLGVARADRVAVVGLGGVETLCALVGVLRANAAFVPVDGDVDPARRDAILGQARPKAIVLCDGVALASAHGAAVLRFGAVAMAGEAPALEVSPTDPAWLMGTSGTTGAPKLAIVPHEAALAHARAIVERFALEGPDRVLQFASLSFDEHAEEIFPTLLAGARLVCRPRIRFEDPETVLALVRSSGLTVLHLPTSYWHLWMDEAATRAIAFPPTLRLVNAGGEQASPARLRTWARQAPRGARWFNTYGLTEAAVTSLAFEVPTDRARVEAMTRVPAGTPLTGTRVRVVDPDGNDAAVDESGELWLGGAGVGLGYLDNAEETAARFATLDGIRWLRTGDLAYRDAAGDIVVTGRRDRAIKIRGQRVDLGDVEGVLARHPSLAECVVAPADDGPLSEGLELYVALRPGQASSEAELLDYWREALGGTPPPRRVVFCSSIPRSAGLKPDLRALRAGRAPRAVATTTTPAADEIEGVVSQAFARLLQREAIDRDASFFSLGGHSLLAMRLVAGLRAELGVELSIADFLAAPSIAGVAAVLRERGAAPVVAAAAAGPEVAGVYPLSAAQRRALALASAAGGDARVGACFELAPGVDEVRLARAWTEVVSRHRLLAALVTEEGNVETDPGAASMAFPAIRSVGGRRYWEIAGSLLALDGSAVAVLLRELAVAYAQGGGGLAPPVGYRRFVDAEAAWMASPSRPAARAYWEDRLRGLESPTRPFGERASTSDDYETRRLRLALGSGTTERVRALAEAQQCTPFHVLLAAFASLAGRFAATDDVLVGVPVSLGEVLGVGEVVGPTLNAVPFRMRVLAGESFAAQVRRVRDLLVRSLPHAALPQEEIAAASPALAALRGTPLPLQFVAQESGVTLPGRAPFLGEAFRREGRSPADLLVGVRMGRTLSIDLEYRRAVVDDATAVAWARAYRTLLASVLANPEGEARSARLLAAHELERRMRARPAVAPAGAATLLHHTLRDGARETPTRIALVDGERRIDYATLERMADRHAARLAERGVRHGELVAIDSRKGAHELVAALAILKLGAGYVPIASELPEARAAKLLSRSGARVLTGAGGREHPGYVVVDLDDTGPAAAVDATVTPDDTAYVLFTSGSTGEPKAVEVSHRAALLTVHEVLRRFGIGRDDVLYGVSSLDFDLSVFDVFGAFAARATLVVPQARVRADAFEWVRDVERHGVTVWNSVPSSFDILLDAAGARPLPSLRRVLLSGDWVGLDLPVRLRAASPQALFVALGGATEAAIWSNCQVVEVVDPAWRSIPYGRALDGHSMFVAEESGWPAPAGAVGEILIGGGGLAKGYRGASELTAERFVHHAISGQRVYRTGDLGRHFPDGTIEFLGRADRQVKVHGFRIEVGEIESVLAGAPGVERVFVNPIGEGRRGTYHSLAAFVLPVKGREVDLDALRRLAEERLPRYMRPGAWRVIDAVPLTANGKVDRAALALPAGAELQLSEAAVDRSFTGTERRIALLWHELLPHRAPRRDEDFFAAGGHSLLAVRLVARVRDETGVEVSLPQWLREPTLANLARLAEGGEGAAAKTGSSIAELERRVRLADEIRFDAARPRGDKILVTGAAGLIGRRLVESLVRQGAQVICLVRPGSRDKAPALPGVQVIEGDLGLVRFGLPEALFEALARQVGVVYHVGATVNLVAGYEALEPANVGGTHEAIRLAALGNATLHHVSSVGVLPYGAGRRVRETDSIEVDGRLMTGYCETKWVAERLVRVAMQRGLRATIHRPGLTIAPEARRDGGVLECMMALASRLGALPALDIPIDVVSADYVAQAIATIAHDARNVGGTFHLTHPRPLSLPALAPVAAASLGLDMQPYETWRTRLAAELPRIEDARSAALAALIVAHDAAAITPATIDCRQAERALAGRVHCAPVADLLSGFLAREEAPA